MEKGLWNKEFDPSIILYGTQSLTQLSDECLSVRGA